MNICPSYKCYLSKTGVSYSYRITRDGVQIFGETKNLNTDTLLRPFTCRLGIPDNPQFQLWSAGNTVFWTKAYGSHPDYCDADGYNVGYFSDTFMDANVAEQEVDVIYTGIQQIKVATLVDIDANNSVNFVNYLKAFSTTHFLFTGVIMFLLSALLIMKLRKK